MKNISYITILLCVMLLGCNNDTTDKFNVTNCPLCEGQEDITILKILKDEPVVIQKACFDDFGRADTFYFVLATNHKEFFGEAVLPCETIPEEFWVENMEVTITGNVINCVKAHGCIEPNIRIAPIHLFELTSIKKQ